MAPYTAYALNDAAQNGVNVKRVVAMTRLANTSELDGSWIDNTYSNCWLGHAGAAWTDGNVDQIATGYDAPGNGNATNFEDLDAAAVDRIWPWTATGKGGKTSSSATIVEFPAQVNMLARAGNANSGDPGRYAGEETKINLRTVTRVEGQDVSW